MIPSTYVGRTVRVPFFIKMTTSVFFNTGENPCSIIHILAGGNIILNVQWVCSNEGSFYTKATKAPYSAGIPQRSLLGPLLWNICNEVLRLPLSLRRSKSWFRRWHCYSYRGKTQSLDSDSSNLEYLGLIWNFCTSITRSQNASRFDNKAKEYIKILVGNQTIRSKEAIKFLGVKLNSRLKFKMHVEYIVKKTSLL